MRFMLKDMRVAPFWDDSPILRQNSRVAWIKNKIIVVKRGEDGALLAMDNYFAFVPAFPIEHVVDPTGAGDSFAGGFLGYLSSVEDFSLPNLKQALLAGTAMSSFAIESFSFDRLGQINLADIKERSQILKSFL